MFKKFKIKKLVVSGVFTTIMMTTLVAFAAVGVTKTISVVYNNIKLVVDGKPVDLGKDSSGKKIEPFIYNGTTYLPVKAVSEALGKETNWDGKTQTVYIGKVPGEGPGEAKYMTEVLQGVMNLGDTYKLGNMSKFKMGGKVYNTGFHTRIYGDYIYFNLDGQYTEVEGEIGTRSTSDYVNDVHIYLDGKLYETVAISGTGISKKIKIPVSGVNELKFDLKMRESNENLHFGLGDLTIK